MVAYSTGSVPTDIGDHWLKFKVTETQYSFLGHKKFMTMFSSMSVKKKSLKQRNFIFNTFLIHAFVLQKDVRDENFNLEKFLFQII